MQKAYTYKVVHLKLSSLIYTNNILLGKINKKRWYAKPVSIEIRGQLFFLKRSGIFNPSILITNESGSIIGHIKIYNFARLFPKAIFEYHDSILIWKLESILSLYWFWKKDNSVIIETIQYFGIRDQKGVIMIPNDFEDIDFLILTGVYLQSIVRCFQLRRLLKKS
jgi:hypothetical protein